MKLHRPSTHPVGDARPEEYQCPIRARLGQLGTDGRPQPGNPDQWWNTADAEAVARDVLGEIETRAFAFFDRIGTRAALLEAIRTGEVRVSGLWAGAIAAWAGDPAYANRLLEQDLAHAAPGKLYALTRRRVAIISAGLGLARPGPDALGEEAVVVRLTCADGSTRDETDRAYMTLHTGLWRILPDDGPDYLQEISGRPEGQTTAILYGPDPAALTRRIRPLLDEVAALPARPQWTVTSGGSR